VKDYRKVVVVLTTVTCAFVLALFDRLTADFTMIATTGMASFVAGNALGDHGALKRPQQ
jgi:hypothetical protein